MSGRDPQLQDWLEKIYGRDGYTLELVSGDASFRRYFRVRLTSGACRIAVDAPPAYEDCAAFLKVADLLEQAGLHVPTVYRHDLDLGFLLLEDLGDELYLSRLRPDTVERLYGDALSALMTMQATVDPVALPVYGRRLLGEEMDLFREWLLGEHLRLSLSPEQQTAWWRLQEILIDAALQQPRVFVHRDYHARNLLVCQGVTPGIIDFQDALAGPLTYDLVSLLRDCYIEWPAGQVDDWVLGYHQLCQQSGVLEEGVSEQEFLRWFDLMGVQRHLKAAGIFARLWHRDGKPDYLSSIPRTLGYIVQVAERRPEIQALAGLIEARVLPKLD